MKKYIYSFLTMLVIGCTLTSCSDDDEPSYNQDGSASAASAGTYSGTWTRTDTNGNQETAPGTILLETGVSTNVVNVTFLCSTFNLNGQSPANISWGNDGFTFHQNVVDKNTANTLETIFAGNIKGGILITTFTKTTKEGRKTTTYYYSFKGNK